MFEHYAMRAVRALGLALLMMITPAILIPCGIELVIAETGPARWFAIALGSGWLALCLFWIAFYARLRKASLFCAVILVLIMAIGIGGVVLTPPSGGIPGENFQSKFLDNASFHPYSLSNLVPEIDQLKLGSIVVGGADPILSKTGSGRLRGLILKIYNEMDQDESFRTTGSALGFCYEDLFLTKKTTLHFYEYIPRQWQRERYPLLIFLHGSMGNFKGYYWVLKRFADATGIAVIAPSYGMGDWDKDSDGNVIRSVLELQESRPELDFSRPYLAGLSNGGRGMTRAIALGLADWAGAIFISPVVEESIVSQPDFAAHSKVLNVLTIQGEQDDRIPVSMIRDRMEDMENQGAQVEAHYFAGEDHFLMFSQPEAITDLMIAWVAKNPR